MRLKNSMQVTVAILGFVAVVCLVVYIFTPVILPSSFLSTPTAISPTQLLDTPTKPADTLTPIPTSTILPTDTPAPVSTPGVSLTATPVNQSLPDLTVTGISNPKCVTDYRDTTTAKIVKLTVYVRNIGRVATRSYGTFDVDVSLIFGETYYTLDEWSSKFNGVIGSTNLGIANLNPNQDVALNIVVDLKGNRKFGVEAVANSGENIIPEANILNNKLRKFFSIYCY